MCPLRLWRGLVVVVVVVDEGGVIRGHGHGMAWHVMA